MTTTSRPTDEEASVPDPARVDAVLDELASRSADLLRRLGDA